MSSARLEVPIDDTPNPEITILVPAMNEQETIGQFLAWCHQGIAESGTTGEILIVDSSTDDTPQIAHSHGARVLHTEPRGLGAAYIEGIPWARGQFVILGDADCTYDFRQLRKFVEAWRSGSEFVMGSRFKGDIERGAMPRLHQYFGTPVTTWILNRIFGSHFSDIHCGMRGVDAQALRAMQISSTGWEYASEMIIKAIQMQLPSAEVPIRFLKDAENRESHMKRRGPLEPFRAGWQNLKSMMTYGSSFFLVRPGIALLLSGCLIFLALLLGPVSVGSVEFSTSTQVVGVFIALIGLEMYLLGIVARSITDYIGDQRQNAARKFGLDRMFRLTLLSTAVGGVLAIPLLMNYVQNDMRLDNSGPINFSLALGGLGLVAASFCLFTASLVIQSIDVRVKQLALASSPQGDRAAGTVVR